MKNNHNQTDKKTTKHSTQKKKSDVRSIPTIDKNGELAVFYNMAYNRMNAFIFGKESQLEIRDIFFPKMENNQRKIGLKEEDLKEFLPNVAKEAYVRLRSILYQQNVSMKQSYVTGVELETINHLLLTLLRLRDYHSHFYHDDLSLVPYPKAKEFLEKKLEIAKRSYKPVYNLGGIQHFDEFSIWQKQNERLNRNGVNFFLSFFLTRGQMELFMKASQFLNRSGFQDSHEDKLKIIDFEKNRYITSFYCVRDAALSVMEDLSANGVTDWNIRSFLQFQLINYLDSLPGVVLDEIKDAAKKVTLVRRIEKRPVQLLAGLLAQKELNNIEWRLALEEEQAIPKETSENLEDSDATLKLPLFRTRKKAQFVPTLDGKTQQSWELYTNKDRIQIRVKISDSQFCLLSVGFDNLLHWVVLHTQNKSQDINRYLTEFATEFADWIEALRQERGIDEQANLSKFALPEVLKNLNTSSNKSLSEDLTTFKNNLKEKIKRELDAAVISSFRNRLDKCNPIKTDYEDEKEQDSQRRSINRLYNAIKRKAITDQEKVKLQQLEDNQRKKEQKRYQKMLVLLDAVAWLTGRKGRFRSAEQKNSFMKYCYLLDKQQWKKDTQSLIIEWVGSLRAYVTEKDERNEEPDFVLGCLQILENDACSFDDCVKRMGELAIEKYEYTLKKIDSYEKYGNLVGLARRLGVKNPSMTQKSNEKNELHKDRRAEILCPFYTEVDGITTYALHLPQDFFEVCTQRKLSEVMQQVKDKKAEIREKWLELLPNDHWLTYNYKALKQDVGEDTKRGVNKKQLKRKFEEHVKTDAVLWKLLEHSDYSELKERFVSIKKRDGDAYGLHIEGCLVIIKPKHLKQLGFYWERNRIQKIIQHLKRKEPEKKEYAFDELQRELLAHWKKSIAFVSGLLQKEQQHLRRSLQLSPHSDQYAERYAYVPFEEIIQQAPELAAFKEFRNKALHADVLEVGKEYPNLSRIQKNNPFPRKNFN